VEAVGQEAGLPQYHASYAESFAFTRVGPVPEREKDPVDLPQVASAAGYRAILGDGSLGGAYQASQELTDRLFEAAVETMAEILRSM
jgi:creatinine amidohydrolase/Fe(II)-dependent formamide hydrolase-like protein